MPDTAGVLREYLRNVQAKFAAGDATEHSYRSALEALLKAFGSDIAVTNEPKRSDCGAPDLSVAQKTGHGSITVGYIEAKDVGAPLAVIEKDSNRANPSSPNGRQLKRYREALPNLVFTDYLEFRHYVNGEFRSEARLASISESGKLVLDKHELTAVETLLQDFLAHEAEPISKPEELARRMARLTHLIRDVVATSFDENKASSNIRSLREAGSHSL